MDYIHELADKIRKVNADNGFDAPTWDNLPIKVMLIVTEIDEGHQAIYKSTADTIQIELADMAIRVLDLLHGVWGVKWTTRKWPEDGFPTYGPLKPYEQVIWPTISFCCAAVEAWRKNDKKDTEIALTFALREIFVAAASMQINLFPEIEAKVAKNATRGHLHGKARADG